MRERDWADTGCTRWLLVVGLLCWVPLRASELYLTHDFMAIVGYLAGMEEFVRLLPVKNGA